MPQSFIANGDISTCRLVKLDTVDGKVVAAGAGDKAIGISQQGTRRSPYIDTSGLAAKAGEPLQVYLFGERCLLEAGGAWTPGAYLKPGTNGVGVATTTDKDAYGARALFIAAVGQLVEVQVEDGYLSV